MCTKFYCTVIKGWLGRKHYAKSLSMDREKKRQMELKRMAAEEALERARMEVWIELAGYLL